MTNLARTQSISSLSSNTPLKPIKVRVPGFVLRGAGFNTHIDYEVKVGGHFAYMCSNEFVTIFFLFVFEFIPVRCTCARIIMFNMKLIFY